MEVLGISSLDGPRAYQSIECISVYAIVVGWNDRDWLGACLTSLQRADDTALRVIYVDNGSSDGSWEFVRETFPDVVVVRAGCNLGFGVASNLAIEIALKHGADYVFLVNPDTRCPEQLIYQLVCFMEDNADCGVVGPLELAYDGSNGRAQALNEWSRRALTRSHTWYFSPWFPKDHVSGNGGRPGRFMAHAYVHGAALLARSAVFREVGLFDPIFAAFYEEIDWCRRARWLGYELGLLRDVYIEHRYRDRSVRSYRRLLYRYRGRYALALTEPELSAREAWWLCARWMASDLAHAVRAACDGQVIECGALISALVWLSCHARALRRGRISRGILLKSGQPIRTNVSPGFSTTRVRSGHVP